MRAEPLIESRSVAIDAEGAELTGRFTPAIGVTRAGLVIHGATGVPQRYYAAFAEWAASQGIASLTYDYRDFESSLKRPLSESKATFSDWIVRDQPAAERALAKLVGNAPLWVLGHSAGGLGIMFHKHDPRIERITTVGSGHAFVADHPWSYLPMVLAFWYAAGPVGTTIAGYLPGRRLMLGSDVPAGVYWQWRRWCTRRDFYAGDIGRSLPDLNYGSTFAPVRLLAVSDDAAVPPISVRRYADTFEKGRVTVEDLNPADYGLKSLGHIEVFAKRNAAVWPTILEAAR